MHDPWTVAFNIRLPWGKRFQIATIWHVDPCKGGGDDSCGFSYPRLTGQQIKRLRDFAWWEARYPYFMREAGKHFTGARAEAEAIYRGLVLHVARVLGIKITFDQAALYAARKIHDCDCSDIADALCFLPGWHSNFAEDRKEYRQERFLSVCAGIARSLLLQRRRWWKHPRWHIWHWHIQLNTAAGRRKVYKD
jgi:hypothetical protein